MERFKTFTEQLDEAKVGDTCSCCDNKIDDKGKCGCGPDCEHCGGQHDMNEAAPKINKGKAKGSISATGLRGKGFKKYDVEVKVDNGKFTFRITDEVGKFQTVGIKQAAKMLGEEVVMDAIDVLDEAKFGSEHGYKITHEKGKKGHRAVMKNKDGKVSYMGGTSYKKPEHAKGEAQAYHDAYFNSPAIKNNDRGAERAVADYRKKNKQHMHEEEINAITAEYINENNISMAELENMTEEELNELIGKAIGGAFKMAAKTAVGAGRMAKKAVNRVSASGRADAAEKKAAAVEKRNADRERIKKAQQRVRDAKQSARNK